MVRPHAYSDRYDQQPQSIDPRSQKQKETKDQQSSSAGNSQSTAATSSTLGHLNGHGQLIGPLHQNLQSQQQQQQHSPSMASGASMNTNDKLTVMREGPEAAICKLRTALDQATNKDATAKTALAKSDAVILELRSSVRLLKKDMERLQSEKEEENGNNNSNSNGSLSNGKQTQLIQQQQQEMAQLNQQQQRNSSNNEGGDSPAVVELELQLDRAHAQILTADMVRKELEDTLEAEQYTWELRVQDQDRTIQMLEEECNKIQSDLNQIQGQWQEAERGWSSQLDELRNQLEQSRKEIMQQKHGNPNDKDDHHSSSSSTKLPMKQLQQQVDTLNTEKDELQSCLNEAMAELEAVDAEIKSGPPGWQSEQISLKKENKRLQKLAAGTTGGSKTKSVGFVTDQASNNNESASSSSQALEPLLRLYRWLQERPVEYIDGNNKNNRNDVTNKSDTEALVRYVQNHVEALYLQLASVEMGTEFSNAREKVADLEQQLKQYSSDLVSREESNADLRASLQEAVGLLKPLQRVVDEAEQEKELLSEQVEQQQVQLMKMEASAASMSSPSAATVNDNTAHQQQQQQQQKMAKELKVAKQDLVVREEDIVMLEERCEFMEIKIKEQQVHLHQSTQPSNEERDLEQRAMQTNDRLDKARLELKSKRASEAALKVLLENAQNKFNQLNHDRDISETEKQELHERLASAEKEIIKLSSEKPEDKVLNARSWDNSSDARSSEGTPDLTEQPKRGSHAERKEAVIEHLKQEVRGYNEDLHNLGNELAVTKDDLDRARKDAPILIEDFKQMEAELKELRNNPDGKVYEMREQLRKTEQDFQMKKESEKILSTSLKEALQLLQPLQGFLETAEKEKKDLKRELKRATRKIVRLEHGLDTSGDVSNMSRSIADDSSHFSNKFNLPKDIDKARKELERMVEELDEENQRLQNALEDISVNLSMSADQVAGLNSASEDMLKENFVELKSRYEVTQKRLDHANDQKQNLLEKLEKKGEQGEEMAEELQALRIKLEKSDHELENAKYIATSALVKVEEMTMESVQNDINISKSEDEMERSAIKNKSLERSPLSNSNMSIIKEDNDATGKLEAMMRKLQAMEMEISTQREVNGSLEQSVRERDAMLDTFAQKESWSTPPRNREMSSDWDNTFAVTNLPPNTPSPSYQPRRQHRRDDSQRQLV